MTMENERRSPLHFIPRRVREELIAMSGEFAGTFLFLFFAFAGTQVANMSVSPNTTSSKVQQLPDPSKLLYISLSFAFSLTVNVWIFFRVTGGLFNPAVSLGLVLIRALPPVRGCLVTFAQILGGMAAAGVVSALLPGPLAVQTSLGGGTSIVRGLFIEMFLTAQLALTIFMLAAKRHKGRYISCVGIGLSLFIAELSGVYFTGGSLNPARSFGPSVVLHKFNHYDWIYWVGPGLGSMLAAGFYGFLHLLDYQTLVPGDDWDVMDAEAQPRPGNYHQNEPHHDDYSTKKMLSTNGSNTITG
ncbi:MAG: hypothetical protein M1834_002623 [Cirrosporium novae-zelandiae]|nr:MAG: hypothetical protein M1834_002623 [Cirrosporium novae-zelandiae]